MPLDEYRRERDFTKTPEPAGNDVASARARKERPAGKTLYFCVKKHLASHLHYDLRLEHDGVLLSWAVPKEPSLISTDKRMAARTEDHPCDYGSFEGVIPEGYGAGIVMLWDQGTWTPGVPDVSSALAKGDLKFSLDGHKLKGSWVLVRTRDRVGTPPKRRGRNWLLIKRADFWSGPVDINEFAPLSITSEGDFDDILAADMPDVWVTGRPATGGGAMATLTRQVIERAAEKFWRAGTRRPPHGGRRAAMRRRADPANGNPGVRGPAPGGARRAQRLAIGAAAAPARSRPRTRGAVWRGAQSALARNAR